jgi:hypothetical protein
MNSSFAESVGSKPTCDALGLALIPRSVNSLDNLDKKVRYGKMATNPEEQKQGGGRILR